LILHLSTISLFASEDKFGYVDAKRILASHPQFEQRQREFQAFSQKKADDARAAAEKETDQTKRMVIIRTAERETGEEGDRLMNPITDEINKIIEEVAKSKGVTIVMHKVLFYYGGIDLTDEVIGRVKKIKE
jgi:outer membrane protein